MAGLPLFGPTPPVQDSPPASPPAPALLPGTSYMRGPGVDSSGAAIQLPANGPSPLSIVRGIAANVASGSQPAVAPAAPVASGGMNGPTMTPQELLAAKQAATASGGLGRFLFGDAAINAAQQANAAPTAAAALGDGLRAAGAAAIHPYQVAAGGLMSVGRAAAGAVNDFASGLLGTAPAAAAPAAAAPAAAPAVTPRPAFTIEPGPRAGVGLIRSGNHIDYVSTDSGSTAAPAAQPQFIARPGTDNDPNGIVTDLSGGLMRNPAYQAPAAGAAAAPAAGATQTDLERQLGIEAGTVAKTLHDAPPSKRPELIQLYANMRGAQQANVARGQYLAMANDRFHGQMNAAGTDATKQLAARQELMERLLSVVNPSALSAGYLPGSLQQQ